MIVTAGVVGMLAGLRRPFSFVPKKPVGWGYPNESESCDGVQIICTLRTSPCSAALQSWAIRAEQAADPVYFDSTL